MLIYIRHADDHGDDDEYQHDRHISDRGRRRARRLASHLLKKYGHPSTIHASPFRRALETAETMSERLTRPVSVHRDPLIAQLLSRKKQLAPDLSSETARAVTIAESQDDFHRRILRHVEIMREAEHPSRGAVWCITHKIVLRSIGKHFDVDVPKELDFLDYVVVDLR